MERLETPEILPEDIFTMPENIDWKSQVSKIISTVTPGVGSIVGVAVNILASVFSMVFNALYLLFGK